jgi:hypothetical protein
MQQPLPHSAPKEDAGATRELGRTGRTIGIVIWTSFLAAGLATTVCFALFDPALLADTPLDTSDINTHRLAVYAGGFFFFWLICVAAAGLTALMLHTEAHHK